MEALVDVSGSYEAVAPATRTLAELVEGMRAGDRLTVRALSGRSYGSSSLVAQLEAPAASRSASRFDPVAQADAAEAMASWAAERSAAMDAILALQEAPKSDYTDIVGGIAAAAETLAHLARRGYERRVILIFTDGRDTGLNRAGAFLDLSGVEVWFMHFESGLSVSEQAELRTSWEDRILGDWGATSVEFIPAGIAVADVLSR
jgi:hypothetical protein